MEALQPDAFTVKYVVSNLAPAMRKAIQKVCPKPVDALDHFHVIQLFTDALERCRKYLRFGACHHSKIHLPAGRKHGIRAITELEFIEVQTGSGISDEDFVRLYFDWDDVIRHFQKSKAKVIS